MSVLTDRFLRFSSFSDEVEFVTERPRTQRNHRSRSTSTCTLGRNDNQDVNDLTEEEVIDLTFDDTSTSTQLLQEGELALANHRVRNESIRPEDCIEIVNSSLGDYNVDFIVVKVVARNNTGDVIIRGIPFTRTRGLKGKLPKKPNEVCRILHIKNGEVDGAPTLIDITTDSFVKKRNLIFTNALYPQYRCEDFNSIRDQTDRMGAIESMGTLVCRWSFKILSVSQGNESKPFEEILERIHESEAPHQYRRTSEGLCFQWRDGRVPGGSWNPNSPETSSAINLEDDEPEQNRPQYRREGQKYTVFDSFSGAGGMSRGAQMAGFKVTRAVDKAEEVWPTYRANFPETKLFKGSVDQFIKRCTRKTRVDILHLSPPCQPFSPAHTRPGVNDDENIFALFSCNSLIDKVRPRIITVEQTFGIIHKRHQEYLRILINDFTQFGYSVRWKIVRLCTWGSAQDRKRLIMIAAAPGENLPPFPSPTHSKDGVGGLKPYSTIRRALRGIRPTDSLHDLNTVTRFQPRKAPYDPDKLAGTLTTGGADFVYPDGSRDFTLREIACLQGFPKRHHFIGNRTSIKRQIGNAFPPNTVKVLYQHLEKWLLRQDGMLPYQQPPVDIAMADVQDGPIIVDDSDGSSARQTRSTSSGGNESPGTDEFVEINDPMEIDDDEPRVQRVNNTQRVEIDLT